MDYKSDVTEAKGVNEGIKQLIYKYFNFNVLEKGQRVQKDMLVNIIETFTYCWKLHKTMSEIEEELIYTEIWELRQRRLKLTESNYNPFPIRLGELKPDLQEEAATNHKNLHQYLLCLLLDRKKRQHTYLDLHCVKRLDKYYRLRKVYTSLEHNQLSLFN